MTNPNFSIEALQRQKELTELQRLQAENARLERRCEHLLGEYAFYEKYNCPWCGGSGHVDDHARRTEAVPGVPSEAISVEKIKSKLATSLH